MTDVFDRPGADGTKAPQDALSRLRWESRAALSSADFTDRYVRDCTRHGEAVADCPHCNLRFLAGYVRRCAAALASASPEAQQGTTVHVHDGEWIEPTPQIEHGMVCCDCGLTHSVDFRVEDGKVQYRVYREEQRTIEARANIKYEHLDTVARNLKSASPEAHTDEIGGCPCLHTTPCDPRCTCVHQHSSRGCRRCASYGSAEQRHQMAEYLAKAIDTYSPEAAHQDDLKERLRDLRSKCLDSARFARGQNPGMTCALADQQEAWAQTVAEAIAAIPESPEALSVPQDDTKNEEEEVSRIRTGEAALDRPVHAENATSDAPTPTTSGTVLHSVDEAMRADAIKQLYEGVQAHDHCHDCVCNGDRRYPRNVRGHGCSCDTRQMRLYRELLALREALRGMVGLHDDPTPYDSATTIAAARAALSQATERTTGVVSAVVPVDGAQHAPSTRDEPVDPLSTAVVHPPQEPTKRSQTDQEPHA